MTNYERIKNMSVEEMVDEMWKIKQEDGCPFKFCEYPKLTCFACWEIWLNQEVEE